jgi:hypothetical protein
MPVTHNKGLTTIKKEMHDVCKWMIESETDLDHITCRINEIYVENGRIVLEIGKKESRK